MVWFLGWEDPLERDTATHSSTLAWRIPWTRGAWRATVHRVARSRAWLKCLSMNAQVFTPWATSLPAFIAFSAPQRVWIFPLHTISHLDSQLNLFSELGLSLKARQEVIVKLQAWYYKPFLRSASTMNRQPSAEGGGRRENCSKNKVPSNVSTNYSPQKLNPRQFFSW